MTAPEAGLGRDRGGGSASLVPGPASPGPATPEQRARGGVRSAGAGLPLPGPAAVTPRPAARALRPQLYPHSCPSRRLPAAAPLSHARLPPRPGSRPVPAVALPGGRPLPSRQKRHGRGPGSEGARAAPRGGVGCSGGSRGSTWTRRADGRGGTGGSSPPPPGASLPARDIGVPGADLGSQGKPIPFQSRRDPSLVTRRS